MFVPATVRKIVLLGFPLIFLSCMSQLASKPGNPVEAQYGPIARSRKIGDVTCYSHKIGPGDWANSENPFVTVVSEGSILQHARLKELIDSLADKEASITRQQATFVSIEVYGIALGDNVRNQASFSPSGIDSDSRLIRYTSVDNTSGWNSFLLLADPTGTIEALDLYTSFRSSDAMHSFVAKLVQMLCDKFIPARNNYIASKRGGTFVIDGVPDYESYKKRMRQYIYTDLVIGVQLDQEKGFIPFIINDRLARPSVYYEDERNLVWLSVRSNRVDARVDRTNEEILKKL
jgi:hypothetical protein